jgi:hypothetical protein
VTSTSADQLRSVTPAFIWGFSVLEVPSGDFEALARLRPLVAERRQVLVAHRPDLVADGFTLLPTLDAPHWTVTLSAPTPEFLERVRNHFRGPIPNPAYRG